MSLKRYRSEKNCQNCGAEVKDKFCPNCGQENIQLHENFFQLIREYLYDYFNYDSKILRSLVPLATKPGFLTKEYWDGKRAHYIHPLRIFFYVTVMFAIATTYYFERHGQEMTKAWKIGDPYIANIDSASLARLQPTDKIKFKNDSGTVAEAREMKIDEARRHKKYRAGMDFVFVNFKYVTFFLLPVYALVFKIFFRKRRKFYVDHIVYTIHLQTFVYCLFSLLMGLMYLYPVTLDTLRQVSFFLIGSYIALSLNYLYKLIWWRTILNSFLITVLLFMITGMSIAILSVLKAMFFE